MMGTSNLSFLSKLVINRSVKIDVATLKKRVLSVYDKTLNTHIISPD